MKLPKKILSFITAFLMTLSVASPLATISAQTNDNTSETVQQTDINWDDVNEDNENGEEWNDDWGPTLTVNCNTEGALLNLVDNEGKQIVQKDGKFVDLTEGTEYTLTVTKFGYKTNVQKVTATDGALSVEVTLEKAPENTLKQVTSEWYNFRNSAENMGITDALTPRNSDEADIKWAVSPIANPSWSNAPSVMIEVDNSIITLAGTKIYKMSKEDGHIVASGDMVGTTNFGYTPPTYANGMIFAPLSNGTIQAFNAETLESLWVSESFGGQSQSPIAYKDGYIYTGFWNSETRDGKFVCISTTDEDTEKTNETKVASWTHIQKGGFYWAGAYAEGETVIVGTDDGESGTSGTGHVLSLDKKTGKVIDSIDVAGDQRSSIAYDKASQKIYFTTKGGYLYSIKLNSDGTFVKDTLKSNKTDYQCTSTPVVHNGRVYFGAGVLGAIGGKVIVANAESLETIYEADLKAYPQASALVSTAYEKEDGTTYLYITYNNRPGGITVMEDKVGQTKPITSELVELPSNIQQYCIASPICDKDGTIYYKNDSGRIIAINKVQKTSVKFDAANGEEAVVKTVKANEALDYTPEVPTKEGYVFVGWYKDVDDITTEYKTGQTYSEETTFTAKYAHVQMLGAQAKAVVDGKSGIRFGTKIFNDGDEIVEKGTLMLPENLLPEGTLLTLNTEKVAKSVGKVLYEENKEENSVTYLGTLVNIPQAQFGRKIAASSYVTYRDSKGNTYTVYSPYVNGSVSINDLLGN